MGLCWPADFTASAYGQGFIMNKLITLVLLISVEVSQAQGQEASTLWREDGRCGEKFPLPSGNAGQCNPAGNGPRKGPCCSPKGFCGNTVKHCGCSGCVDYSEVAEKTTEPTKLKKIKTKTKPAKDIEPLLSIDIEPTDTKDSMAEEENTDTEIVQTRIGAIKGKHVTTEDGSTHYQFISIPYAQPPVGPLRFKPPLPVRPWTKTLDAVKYGPLCYQKSSFLPDGAKPMSEDCLHLSIYTEDMKLTSKPVMVWIHGGGFTEGSGNDYLPKHLIKEGVIVVTINYRLGSLGFLTFGNDIVSGNMGLKDQALAIQWVKQNIHNFGGNPNKITIFGESAGAFSVHAQVLSPWNFGQIQGAIAQSGTMLFYNSMKSFGSREELFANNAAKILGCSSSEGNLDQLTLDCLQNIDIQQISEKLVLSENTVFEGKPAPFEWRPVIDNYATNPFLPLDPLEAMKTGIFNRIPFMSGTIKNEGALWVGGFKATGQAKNLIKNWETFGPRLMLNSPSIEKASIEETLFANISLKYYNHPEGDSALAKDQPLMDLFTDVSFISPDQKTVQLMSKYSRHVFNYFLTQQTDNSLLGKLFNLGKEYTPMHADDIFFLMDVFGQKIKMSEEESSLSNHMIKYWTNFAKYGHPTPSTQDLPFWDSVTETEHNYMELKAVPEMGQDLNRERMMFWERMLWAAKEETIDRKIMYTKATQFLLDNKI